MKPTPQQVRRASRRLGIRVDELRAISNGDRESVDMRTFVRLWVVAPSRIQIELERVTALPDEVREVFEEIRLALAQAE